MKQLKNVSLLEDGNRLLQKNNKDLMTKHGEQNKLVERSIQTLIKKRCYAFC